jgi:hypothetical protein
MKRKKQPTDADQLADYAVRRGPWMCAVSDFRRAILKQGGKMMNAMREVAHYDASAAPDPEAWLQLDEQERIDLAIEYHRRYHLRMGQSQKLHGVIVENQVALGDVTVVPATLARLMREGLDRHDAIHAIGSILMGIVFDVLTEKDDAGICPAYPVPWDGHPVPTLPPWRTAVDFTRKSVE